MVPQRNHLDPSLDLELELGGATDGRTSGQFGRIDMNQAAVFPHVQLRNRLHATSFIRDTVAFRLEAFPFRLEACLVNLVILTNCPLKRCPL